ncbi:MAG: glycosyltransferase [Candidatus Omnitrophica bacterium]|nr:glycosyltransferase [Candidatus Omnitrophota bacterium]
MVATTDNTIVVIPSFNEARTIGSIVRHIVGMGLTVLVIDDGSVDNTERAALDNGAIVIRHRRNLGKGFSVREGIRHVLKKTNFEWMIMMDGDGQHHPEDIPALMERTRSEEVEIVIGNRMLQTKTMPSARFWTNKFMSWVISGICKQQIPDTQCGFRLIKTKVLEMLKLTSQKYDIESEMLMQAAHHGMNIASVKIQTIYGEEISEIHPVRDTIRFFKLIFTHHMSPNGLRYSKKKNGR